MTRSELIRQRLEESLSVVDLDLEDQSHLHAGHAGAKAGGGHFRLRVISPDFEGLARIARHRLIYRAIGDAMRADTIHALSIEAFTPSERQ